MDVHNDLPLTSKRCLQQFSTHGECPNCGGSMLEGGVFNTTHLSVERKITCVLCGLVFYAVYEFKRLIFDGWMYGGRIKENNNARGLSNTEGKDLRTQQSVGSNGHIDTKVNRSKRSTLGSGRRSTKKGGKKTKRSIPSKKDKGAR